MTMKINERHLVTFANGSATVDRQGYLNKRGELNKSFQRRWFVLKGNLLFYFDKKGDQEPIGVIILEGCSVELVENTDKYSFELAFLGSGARTYVLAADSQEEMEEWMQVLACAGYEYMKCAVEELQRQMDELNAANHRVNRSAVVVPPSGIAAEQDPDLSALIVHPKRKNPFNQRESDGDNCEPPLIVTSVVCHQNRENDTLRTFTEMHDTFGAYIQQRTAECSKRKSRVK